ncbi:MAG: S-layer homology domain-containing protein [Eubacteriales bacterium]
MVLSGDYPGGAFSPDGPLTREEAAALAGRVLANPGARTCLRPLGKGYRTG